MFVESLLCACTWSTHWTTHFTIGHQTDLWGPSPPSPQTSALKTPAPQNTPDRTSCSAHCTGAEATYRQPRSLCACARVWRAPLCSWSFLGRRYEQIYFAVKIWILRNRLDKQECLRFVGNVVARWFRSWQGSWWIREGKDVNYHEAQGCFF